MILEFVTLYFTFMTLGLSSPYKPEKLIVEYSYSHACDADLIVSGGLSKHIGVFTPFPQDLPQRMRLNFALDMKQFNKTTDRIAWIDIKVEYPKEKFHEYCDILIHKVETK